METTVLSRRDLLRAGLSVTFASMFPAIGWSVELPEFDLSPIGPNAPADSPYRADAVGYPSDEIAVALRSLLSWMSSAWEFTNMEECFSALPGTLSVKTSISPSYLAEYTNAATLINSARKRLGTDEKAFAYLMFAARGALNRPESRLGRARFFVFDELTRYLIANGGFRRFGFVNYEGFISTSFYDASSYRKAKV